MYFTPIPYWKWQIPEAPAHTKRSRRRTRQDNPVGQVSFRFQRYRAAIDERLALLQNGSVIQQPVSFVHGLIAQQAEAPRFRKKDLPGVEKNVW